MWSGFFETIQNEIVSWSIPAFIGYCFGELVQLFKRRKRKNTIQILKTDLKGYENKIPPVIDVFDHAAPEYDSRDITLKKHNLNFFLGFENKLSQQLREYGFPLKDEVVFRRGWDLNTLEVKLGIKGLANLIEKKKQAVAQSILDKRLSGLERHNSRMYGLYLSGVNRSEGIEADTLKFEFYISDYYTHLVMQAVQRELVQTGFEFERPNKAEDLAKYYPLTAAFGICCHVLLNKGDGPEVVVCKRKSDLDVYADRWHTSVGEAFSLGDAMEKNVMVEPSLDNALYKGLNEELRIKDDRISGYGFTEYWFDSEVFQVGVLAYACLELTSDFTYEMFKRDAMTSKDSTIEFQDIDTILLENIEEEIHKKEKKFTATCEAGLLFLATRYRAGELPVELLSTSP
ncbi:hypothetical protein [Maridesulfovibrio sp.]|uniref:hypothetical protein n=1 Tax=Maridesulfovibrio sp. TaxID=2795000 RepID=UPI003BAB8605